MTEAYRTSELTKAREEQAKARAAFDAQPCYNAKKRKAAEDLEFWGNKVAFLSNPNLTASEVRS